MKNAALVMAGIVLYIIDRLSRMKGVAPAKD